MARLRVLLPRASWQGPIGAALVVYAVLLLTAPAWAVLTAGGFLLLGAAGDAGVAIRRRRDDDGEDAE